MRCGEFRRRARTGVLVVARHVAREPEDPLGKDGDLHLARARVGGEAPPFLYRLLNGKLVELATRPAEKNSRHEKELRETHKNCVRAIRRVCMRANAHVLPPVRLSHRLGQLLRQAAQRPREGAAGAGGGRVRLRGERAPPELRDTALRMPPSAAAELARRAGAEPREGTAT